VFYTIYKTTNNLDGKIYIGKHQTKDLEDDYLGSGKHLGRGIEKHGRENFSKEILYIFDNEKEMNVKEAELVSEEFVGQDTNYNLCPGGQGGWGYVNTSHHRTKGHTPETFKKISDALSGRKNPNQSENLKIAYAEGRRKPAGAASPEGLKEMQKRAWSSESSAKRKATRERIKFQQGSNNSQHDTMWIYSLEEKRSKKIKKSDDVPEGWSLGRKLKF
jgi:hypothetical protein